MNDRVIIYVSYFILELKKKDYILLLFIMEILEDVDDVVIFLLK